MTCYKENKIGPCWWAGLLAATFVSCLPAQPPLAMTRISASATDAVFLVDGQAISGSALFTWPAGSKHDLEIAPWLFAPYHTKTRYVFQHWSIPAGPLPNPSNRVTITADPGIPRYNADLTTEYAVSLNFYQCPEGPCTPPGAIWLNQVAYSQDTDIWLGAGSTVMAEASPNPGFVFTGWGQNGGVLASVNIFVLNAGTTLYPRFAIARAIKLSTVPEGLKLLADRESLEAPITLEWGWNTSHTLAAVSPQPDRQGRQWVLRSWSDGGALSHSYEVAPGPAALTLTAEFAPGAAVQLLTDPAGLPLTVDGTDGITPRYSSWVAGDQHTISAPPQATDAQGGPWKFRQWSNGAPNPQTIQLKEDQVAMGVRLTAIYDPLSRIRIDSVPSGLTMAVDGIDCHTPCEVQRPVGAIVRLSAPLSIAAGDGARLDFSSWDGAAGGVLTAAAGYRKVTATYQMSYRLTLSTAPPAAGSWRLVPISADGYFPAGTAVAVGIDAADGMKFHGWAQDSSGIANPQTITMDGPHAVQARFDRLPDKPTPPRISNAAGDTPVTAVAPGSIASLIGSDLADSAAAAGDSDALPQSLAGVTLICAGHLLPLLYVSDGQINFQIPGDFAPGHYQVELHRAGSQVAAVDLNLERNAPGLLVAAHLDGSAVTGDSPAHPGETVVLYGTGLGPYTPMPMDGFKVPATPTFSLADPVVVVAQGRALIPDLAAAASGVVGVTIVRFRIPEDLDRTAPTTVLVAVAGTSSNALVLPLM